MLSRTYERFLHVVSAGRKLPLAAVREVAEGRVWTGRQALDNGLVDRLGDLDVDALADLTRSLHYARLARLGVLAAKEPRVRATLRIRGP